MRGQARIPRLERAIAHTVFRRADTPVPVTVRSCRQSLPRDTSATGKLAAVFTPRAESANPGLLTALWRRFGDLVHEVGKFGVVGACTFVIDVTIFTLLRADI